MIYAICYNAAQVDNLDPVKKVVGNYGLARREDTLVYAFVSEKPETTLPPDPSTWIMFSVESCPAPKYDAATYVTYYLPDGTLIDEIDA